MLLLLGLCNSYSKYSTMVSASAFQVDDPSSSLGTYILDIGNNEQLWVNFRSTIRFYDHTDGYKV